MLMQQLTHLTAEVWKRRLHEDQALETSGARMDLEDQATGTRAGIAHSQTLTRVNVIPAWQIAACRGTSGAHRPVAVILMLLGHDTATPAVILSSAPTMQDIKSNRWIVGLPTSEMTPRLGEMDPLHCMGRMLASRMLGRMPASRTMAGIGGDL